MVLSTVAHVAAGALLLATTVILAIQVRRHLPASSMATHPVEHSPTVFSQRNSF
jgi:hypothetical protein